MRAPNRTSLVVARQRDPLAILAIDLGELGGELIAKRELARGELPMRVRSAATLHFKLEWAPPDEFFRRLFGNRFEQAQHAKRVFERAQIALALAVNDLDLGLRLGRRTPVRLHHGFPGP